MQGGRLDWGLKSSFQSYVTGPIAKGSYSLTSGAATVGTGSFRFHSATGTYDGDTGAFAASFSGGVHFVGHKTDAGTYQLDLTISHPTVRASGSTGTLHVDVTSKAKGTGTVTTSSQVPFASLSLGGIDMRGGGSAVVLNNLPATLTAEGAKSFAGYCTAGTELGPVDLSVALTADAELPGDGGHDGRLVRGYDRRLLRHDGFDHRRHGLGDGRGHGWPGRHGFGRTGGCAGDGGRGDGGGRGGCGVRDAQAAYGGVRLSR
ncbi:Htaa protein [Streptomyces sp. cf386]|nr:Htaa protein [Streptomyces sp. cf386]